MGTASRSFIVALGQTLESVLADGREHYEARLGIDLLHFSGAQFHEGAPVPFDALAPGDLVFFEPGPLGPGHVGMYVGGGRFIQAPHSGDVVRISRLDGPRYGLRFVGAVRPYLP